MRRAIKRKPVIHYDAYIPYTGYYALCSDDEDLTPKSRNIKDITCPTCKKCLQVRADQEFRG